MSGRRRRAAARARAASAVAIGAAVVIGALPSAAVARRPATGSLRVTVTALPSAERAAVTIRGPHGFRRSLTARHAATFAHLTAGTYRVVAASVRFRAAHGRAPRGSVALPDERSVRVKVLQGRRSSAVVRYGTVRSAAAQTLQAAPLRIVGSTLAPRAIVLRRRDRPRVGAVLTSGPRAGLPDGLLARVTAVHVTGGTATVELQPATLADALPALSVDEQVPLSFSGAHQASTAGARTSANGLDASLELGGVGCGTPTLTGFSFASRLHFSPTLDLSAHLPLFGSRSAHVIVGGSAGVDVQATLPTGFHCQAHIPIVSPSAVGTAVIALLHIPVFAGVLVDVTGTADAPVDLAVRASASGRAGLLYEGGHLQRVLDVTGSASGSVTATAGSLKVGPTLEIGLGHPDVASITNDFSPGLELSAGPAGWRLDGVFEVEAGVSFGPLHLQLPAIAPLHHTFLHGGEPAPVPPPPSPPPTRSLTDATTGEDLACTVRTAEDGADEFFTTDASANDACGTFLAVDGQLYGPADVPAGGSLGAYAPWTPVDQTTAGSGSADDPFVTRTAVTAGSTGVSLVETDRWTLGGSTLDSTYEVSSDTETAQVELYRAADCYVGGSDFGYGSYDPASQTVGCLRTLDGGGQVVEQLQPTAGAASSTEDFFATIWGDVATQAPLTAGCACDAEVDDGVATSWSLDVAPSSPASAASRFAFAGSASG